MLEEHEGGDEENDARDEHGRYGETEEQIPSWKAQAREAIANHSRGEHRTEADGPGIEYAVPYEPQKRIAGIGQCARKVIPARHGRPPLDRPREDLARVLECGDDHPIERRQ